MIFIYNTTGQPLRLKAVEDEDNKGIVNLHVVMRPEDEDFDTIQFLSASKEHAPEAAAMLLEQFGGEGVELKNQLFGKKLFIKDKAVCFDAINGTIIQVDKNDSTARENYKFHSRVITVVVTAKGGKAFMDIRNLKTAPTAAVGTFKENEAFVFFSRWNNWQNLRFPIELLVRDNNESVKLIASSKSIKRNNRTAYVNTYKKVEWDREEEFPTKIGKKEQGTGQTKVHKNNIYGTQKKPGVRPDNKTGAKFSKGNYSKKGNRR